MKKLLFIYSLIILIFTGCQEIDLNEKISEDCVGDITALSERLVNSSYKTRDSFDDAVKLLDESFEKDKSYIYISQMGTTLDPFSQSTQTSNFYTYVYNGNSNVTWTSGTNFSPLTNDIKWSEIQKNGLVGNVYSLYALYSPTNNNLTINEINNLSVKTDQRSLDNLQSSNILGAYHATSSLFSPLKFRLFHLNVYLLVNVYIPVFDSEDNSGFNEDAFGSAQVLNVNTEFSINWRALRVSDIEPPLVQLKNGNLSDINMYYHLPENGKPIEESLNLNDFYGNYSPSSSTEKVYKFTFSALFPPQSTSFSDNDFLKFTFKTPGNIIRNYYYSAKTQQLTGNFGMSQGVIQELNLFIPRNGNGVILISANVNPWTPAETDMNVTKKE